MSASAFDKIIVVTRKTALEELIERFNTREQARFYLEHSGASFDEYQAAHDAYQHALRQVKAALPDTVRHQFIARGFLPNFLFGERDLVLTLGPDGLVVNTAKYLNGQPLVALNPDSRRIDGVLVPFAADRAEPVLRGVLRGAYSVKRVSMAKASLNDGQSLYAVNDLFIGQKSHQSARYQLRHERACESQSSSGIIVSTGAGSTGWFRSILTGASGIVDAFASDDVSPQIQATREQYRFDWEADYVCYSVREPFISKTSHASVVFGRISAGQTLELTSQMPQNGVIFSDGIEEDYLEFNSGAIARIGLAEKKVHLVVQAG